MRLRAAQAGIKAEARLGKSEARVGRYDDPVAGQGQFETAAQGQAVHAGDHRLRGAIDGVEQVVAGLAETDNPSQVAGLNVPEEKLDVGPAYKGPARTGKQQTVDFAIGQRLTHGLMQLEHDRRIQGIERVRAVDRELGDSVHRFEGNERRGLGRGRHAYPFANGWGAIPGIIIEWTPP